MNKTRQEKDIPLKMLKLKRKRNAEAIRLGVIS